MRVDLDTGWRPLGDPGWSKALTRTKRRAEGAPPAVAADVESRSDTAVVDGHEIGSATGEQLVSACGPDAWAAQDQVVRVVCILDPALHGWGSGVQKIS